MRPPLTVPLLLFVLMVPARASVAQSGSERSAATEKARAAARTWLALVDEDAYQECWDTASPLFREEIEAEEWAQRVERLRDSVAAPGSRTLVATQYRDALQRSRRGGPFVLLKYRSGGKTGRLEELVVTVLEDTTWKVAGYQVMPLPSRSPHPSSAGSPNRSQ